MKIINMVSHYVPLDPASEPFLGRVVLFLMQFIVDIISITPSEWVFVYVSSTFGPVLGPVYLTLLRYAFN